MSNTLVGPVYQSIIDEVIQSSEIDFEEAGVNVSTLKELKQVWQKKLSDTKIAHFPWDPPAVDVQNANGVAAQQQQQQRAHQQQHAQHMQHMQQQQGQPGPPHIKQEQYQGQGGMPVKVKTEPGHEPQGNYGVPTNLTGNPTHDPQLAAMRAQQNIAQRFGPQQFQARQQPGLVLPAMNPALPQPNQQRPNGQQNGIPQHDGADEEDLILVEGFKSLTREEADGILLRRIGNAEARRAKATAELSDALQSLKIKSNKPGKKSRQKSRRKIDAYDEALNPNSSFPYPSLPTETTVLPSSPTAGIQMDAAGDSGEENDEDAINSDLDDPEEDEIDSDEDGDTAPQIMLCMYDKVQRTKNKWKCVLKDGVLTINGQEYVFHKANGEYEW